MRNKRHLDDESCGMTPAAIMALAMGQDDNFLAAALPGGIERQEKQGQLKQAALQTLPIKGLAQYVPYLESLGFVFGADADKLFRNVQFPEGWKKVPTDHSMWSDLVDEKGRKRAGIFYKAAFYDQSAHISMNRRYSTCAYQDGTTPQTYKVVAKDGERILETFGEYPRGQYKEGDALREKAGAWLTEQFPGWDSEDAYKLFWD